MLRKDIKKHKEFSKLLGELNDIQDAAKEIKSAKKELQKKRGRLSSLLDKYSPVVEALNTSSGDVLNHLVAEIFKLVGYKKVVEIDNKKHPNREDVNIWYRSSRYIIEVKGKDKNGLHSVNELTVVANYRESAKGEDRNKGKTNIQYFAITVVSHEPREESIAARDKAPITDDMRTKATTHNRVGLVSIVQLVRGMILVRNGVITLEEFDEKLRGIGEIRFTG